jgi:hypothetical protein
MPYDLPSTRSARSKFYDALLWQALSRRTAAGPPGGGNDSVFAVAFSFASASPVVIHVLPIGSIVTRASIRIDTAFDGAGASLRLGTPASPALFLAAGDNLPSALGQYDGGAGFIFAAPDIMQLVIVPGAGATQGAGFVFAQIKL